MQAEKEYAALQHPGFSAHTVIHKTQVQQDECYYHYAHYSLFDFSIWMAVYPAPDRSEIIAERACYLITDWVHNIDTGIVQKSRASIPGIIGVTGL
jgi:hypothetical protein